MYLNELHIESNANVYDVVCEGGGCKVNLKLCEAMIIYLFNIYIYIYIK